jgi:anti-sigma B factor antagonist
VAVRELEVEVVHCESTVLVRVSGEIDLASAPSLARVLAALEEQPNHGAVVLDVARVSYLDAAGIAVVVDHDRRMQAYGARLVLRDPSPLVRRVLEVTGDHDLVEQR